ncbi:NADPH-dependent FMN reductase [Oceanisphaera profunda]|uniref:NADPH-dependent FMN reductase n=1 Tax=Oceanisphaera profunda TaxID=1416627 RepID=A0A1Y0D841_9GAMM|nr:NAD(P)H-dependent oxidoreductase [Oceanisphaera profunda]ART83306.1 NADPH-dependent FMN reductase [Oceanisphaera profunda]
MKKTKIIAFSGSLRAASFNTFAIKAAQQLAPAGCEIELINYADLPLYNQDEADVETPALLLAIAEKVRAADGILFATPEYNYSLPGALKNLIDWLSRQAPQPLAGKPTAIISASMGMLGGARVQYHLRQILVCLDVHVLNKPEIMIGQAHEKFDAQGQLLDETTNTLIATQMQALCAFSQQLD